MDGSSTPKSDGDSKMKCCGGVCRDKLKKWSKECCNLFSSCFNFSKNSSTSEENPLYTGSTDTQTRGSEYHVESGVSHGQPQLYFSEESSVRGFSDEPAWSEPVVTVDDSFQSQYRPEAVKRKPKGPEVSKEPKVLKKPREPYTPQLHKYSVHKMKEFPPEPFQSSTYNGPCLEVKKWVLPLKYNTELHDAFLKYIIPPRTIDKLKELSRCLQELETSLEKNKEPPQISRLDLSVIIDKLSVEFHIRLSELKSLIILSEALIEFPQHIVKRAIDLPQDKRQTLVDFISSTPYGVDKHVYMDEGPYNDPDLYPIMTRLGFSVPSTSSGNVEYSAPDDNEDDILAAGFFLLLGTETDV